MPSPDINCGAMPNHTFAEPTPGQAFDRPLNGGRTMRTKFLRKEAKPGNGTTEPNPDPDIYCASDTSAGIFDIAPGRPGISRNLEDRCSRCSWRIHCTENP